LTTDAANAYVDKLTAGVPDCVKNRAELGDRFQLGLFKRNPLAGIKKGFKFNHHNGSSNVQRKGCLVERFCCATSIVAEQGSSVQDSKKNHTKQGGRQNLSIDDQPLITSRPH